MSVNPGFGGQSFIPGALKKIERARRLIDASGRESGSSRRRRKTDNIRAAFDAGADTFVATAAHLRQPDYPCRRARRLGALTDRRTITRQAAMTIGTVRSRRKKFAVEVEGRRAAIDEGAGSGDTTIVFQHGNPTSSPGANDDAALPRPPGGWSPATGHSRDGRLRTNSRRPAPTATPFAEQRRHALWRALELQRPRHWRTAATTGARRSAFDQHTGTATNVLGIAYMEALVMPVTWADWPGERAQGVWVFARRPARRWCCRGNVFVERVAAGLGGSEAW